MVRRWLPLSLVLLMVLFGASCLELEQTLELAADGSGKLHVTIRVDQAAIERVKAERGFQPSEEEQAAEKAMFDVERIRKNFESLKRVKLLEIKSLDDDKTRGMKASLQFESQEALVEGMRALVARPEGRTGGDLAWLFVKAGEGRLRLVVYPSGRADYQQASEQVQRLGSLGEEERAMQENMFRVVRSSLEGMRVTWRIKVPGAIDKAEGLKRIADDTAELTLSSADVKTMEDLARLSGLRFVLEFAGQVANVRVLDTEPTDAAPSGKTEKAGEAGK